MDTVGILEGGVKVSDERMLGGIRLLGTAKHFQINPSYLGAEHEDAVPPLSVLFPRKECLRVTDSKCKIVPKDQQATRH